MYVSEQGRPSNQGEKKDSTKHTPCIPGYMEGLWETNDLEGFMFEMIKLEAGWGRAKLAEAVG